MSRGTIPGHWVVGNSVLTIPVMGLELSKSNQGCLRETCFQEGLTPFSSHPREAAGVVPYKDLPLQRRDRHPISPAGRAGKLLGLRTPAKKAVGTKGAHIPAGP